jgi:glycosyltransferase involved in cell wall biosynthesis
MNIVIISTSHPYKTAGVVAYDIYTELQNKGNNVKLLVKAWDKYTDKNIIPVDTYYGQIKNRIIERLRNVFIKLQIIKPTNPDYHVVIDQTITYFSTKKLLSYVDFKPDVIIIMFMQKFVSYKNIFELGKSTGAKIYQMPMDMGPYTGACHYAWDCDGYKKKCGNCPALYSEDPDDQSRVNWEYKNKYLQSTDITILPCTEWQINQIKKSSLFKNKPYQKILLSVNPYIFKPVNKNELKLKLKISPGKKVIFFGSISLKYKRKGMSQLLESLQILYSNLKKTNLENDVLLLIAGSGIESIQHLLNFEHKYLGVLNNGEEMAAAYQASDIFVCPSIEDAGPTMINQSIMCGTPVVAFEMGVALDLVISGETGYRAKLKDNSDLAFGMEFIIKLNDTDYDAMSKNCRDLGLQICSPKTRINKINDLLQANLI